MIFDATPAASARALKAHLAALSAVYLVAVTSGSVQMPCEQPETGWNAQAAPARLCHQRQLPLPTPRNSIPTPHASPLHQTQATHQWPPSSIQWGTAYARRSDSA